LPQWKCPFPYIIYNHLKHPTINTQNIPEVMWAEKMNCAVTVCDKDGIVLYMNERARETFAKHGDMVGRSLIPCHSDRSRSIIASMLDEGHSNAYTIEKEGKRKMIYQTPWRDAAGNIAGLVEISMVIPADMPHYIR